MTGALRPDFPKVIMRVGPHVYATPTIGTRANDGLVGSDRLCPLIGPNKTTLSEHGIESESHIPITRLLGTWLYREGIQYNVRPTMKAITMTAPRMSSPLFGDEASSLSGAVKGLRIACTAIFKLRTRPVRQRAYRTKGRIGWRAGKSVYPKPSNLNKPPMRRARRRSKRREHAYRRIDVHALVGSIT